MTPRTQASPTPDPPHALAAERYEILARILRGELSLDAARQRYGLHGEEVQRWLRHFHRAALNAFDEQMKQTLIRYGAEPGALSHSELRVSLETLSIVDWLQGLQMFAEHALVRIEHEPVFQVGGSPRESRIWVARGVLIDAESGHLRGEAAVYRIASLERGQVVTELGPFERERTVHLSMQGVLLEAARRKDEAALLRRRLGGLDRYYRAAPDHVAVLDGEESMVLRRFEEPRRLGDVLEESELGDVETLAVIESSRRQRQLTEVPAPEALVGDPAPSPRESRGAPAPAPITFVWPDARSTRRRNVRWLASTLGMALVVSSAAWLGARRSAPSAAPAPVVTATQALRPQPEEYPVVVHVEPPRARLELDGQSVGVGHWSARLRRDGALHELRVSADGFVPARVLFVDTAPPLDIHLEPLPAATEGGQRDVGTTSAGAPEPAPAALEREAAARRSSVTPRRERATKGTSRAKRKPYVQIIEDPVPRATQLSER